MKNMYSLALKLIVLACLIYSSAAKDGRDEGFEKHKRNKGYTRIKAEDPYTDPSTLKKEVSPLFIFPEQAHQISLALKNGASELCILMKIKEPFNRDRLVEFPAMDDLKHLRIYHTLTLDREYDRRKLQALQGLLKAPSLETIEFTAFLAKDIMPFIGPKVQATADFEHRDMGAAVMVPKTAWDEGAKTQLIQLCEERGWTVGLPSNLSSAAAGS